MGDPDASPRVEGHGDEAYPLAAMSCCGYSFFCIFAPTMGCCGNAPGKKVMALEKMGEKVYVRQLSRDDLDTRDAMEKINAPANDQHTRAGAGFDDRQSPADQPSIPDTP